MIHPEPRCDSEGLLYGAPCAYCKVKNRPVLYLDIDGCLNGHAFDYTAQSNTLKQECVGHLNRVLDATGCDIVLSSAWRYIIHGGAMTLQGFEYLLRTHLVGIGRKGRLVGITEKDRDNGWPERVRLIRKHAAENNLKRYAVVDDGPLGEAGPDFPFVRCDGAIGMTAEDADRLIEILGRENEA